MRATPRSVEFTQPECQSIPNYAHAHTCPHHGSFPQLQQADSALSHPHTRRTSRRRTSRTSRTSRALDPPAHGFATRRSTSKNCKIIMRLALLRPLPLAVIALAFNACRFGYGPLDVGGAISAGDAGQAPAIIGGAGGEDSLVSAGTDAGGTSSAGMAGTDDAAGAPAESWLGWCERRRAAGCGRHWRHGGVVLEQAAAALAAPFNPPAVAQSFLCRSTMRATKRISSFP